jgi:hypothetical protein
MSAVAKLVRLVLGFDLRVAVAIQHRLVILIHYLQLRQQRTGFPVDQALIGIDAVAAT